MYPPSVGPALVGAPHKVAFILTQWTIAPLLQWCIDPMPGLAMWWPFLHLFPLLCHTLWAPMPWVLQRWLYQPCQQTRRWKCLWSWQVQHHPQPAALPHLCMSMPKFTTMPASLRASGYMGDTGALATAGHAPLLPLYFLMSPARLALSFTHSAA